MVYHSTQICDWILITAVAHYTSLYYWLVEFAMILNNGAWAGIPLLSLLTNPTNVMYPDISRANMVLINSWVHIHRRCQNTRLLPFWVVIYDEKMGTYSLSFSCPILISFDSFNIQNFFRSLFWMVHDRVSTVSYVKNVKESPSSGWRNFSLCQSSFSLTNFPRAIFDQYWLPSVSHSCFTLGSLIWEM